MKKQLLTLGLLGILTNFSALAHAQDFVQKKITNENGGISLVVFKENSGLNNEKANNLFKDILKLKPNEELRLVKTELDSSSKMSDEKYQLYTNNIKVEGGVYYLHYKNGKLISMNGEIFQDKNSVLRPEISAVTAFNSAVKSVGAQKYMWEDADYIAENDYRKPTGELVYIPVSQGNGKYSLILAYKFDIYAAQPLSRANIYVDATTGRIAATDLILKHAKIKETSSNLNLTLQPEENSTAVFPTRVAGTASTRYSGNQNIETTLSNSNKYILHDTTRGNGVRTYNLNKSQTLSTRVDFEDDDNNWTKAEFNNVAFDDAALDAHWGVEKTYDYFKNTFNRDSYDGLGTLLKSYVHYGNQYENAGWTGSEMVYGDGKNNFKPLTAFDVTAHELGHGVCSSSANLIYSRESGALNEALSDIWAAAVEYTYAPEKETWLIGEDITKIAPGYLRSMSNPKSGLSPQPDTYRGINWYPATVEEGCASPNSNTNDNCGVHYNSGVINFWFYILSVGKTGTNDFGRNYNVIGIGIEKAAKIVYRLETAYLTANSDFKTARNFGVQAAIDLFGADSPEAIATQDAFYAVGIGPKYLSTPDTTPPTTPTNLAASNTTGNQTLLTWNASTDENEIENYIIFKNGVQLATVPATKLSYIASGLSANTTYNFYIKAEDPYANSSEQSNTVSVTTLNVPNYCAANSNSTTDERIKRVQFGNIDNTTSGTAGYEDFSYLSTDVVKNTTYDITITPEWKGTQFNEGYGVFVDWNNDGDFEDADEIVFTKAPSKTTPVVGSIKVPETYTYTGPVRMRVILKFNSIPSACGTINYGQIEDYTLNVMNSTLAVANTDATKTSVYPNPVRDIISIQSKVNSEFSYKMFNTVGQVVLTGNSAGKEINVSKLTVGTYILELTDKDGKVTTTKIIKQ